MSRKTCFMIFIAAVTIILVSYVIKFSPVTGAVSSVFAAMQNPYLAASAVVVSLLLAKQRYYWLLILGCAVLAAVLIQFLSLEEPSLQRYCCIRLRRLSFMHI